MQSNHPTLELKMPAVGEVRCVWEAQAALGEGAVWSPRERALYWVDILGKRLHCYTPHSGDRSSWPFQEEISALSLRQDGAGLVLALRRGLALWSPEQPTQEPQYLAVLDAQFPGNRCNDGKCDAQGNFWIGTMDFDCVKPTGSLYRVDPRGRVVQQDQGFVVTNGPTWTLDAQTLLFNDSVNGTVLAYDVDAEAGSLSGRRTWLQLSPGDGVPDGMCTDAAGRIWICHWAGSCISCHDPRTAQELGRIEFPVSQVTSCAFAGDDLSTLYVTCARTGLDSEALRNEPLAGALFAVTVSEPGRLAHVFAG